MNKTLPAQNVKLLRPYYRSEHKDWIIAYKHNDDPEETPWRQFVNRTFIHIDHARGYIYVLCYYCCKFFLPYDDMETDTFPIELPNHEPINQSTN